MREWEEEKAIFQIKNEPHEFTFGYNWRVLAVAAGLGGCSIAMYMYIVYIYTDSTKRKRMGHCGLLARHFTMDVPTPCCCCAALAVCGMKSIQM